MGGSKDFCDGQISWRECDFVECMWRPCYTDYQHLARHRGSRDKMSSRLFYLLSLLA